MGPAARPTGEAPPTRIAAHRRRGAAVLPARGHRPPRRRPDESPAAHRTGDRRGAGLGARSAPSTCPTNGARTGRKAAARGPGSAGCWASTPGGTSRSRSASGDEAEQADPLPAGVRSPPGPAAGARGGCWSSSRTVTRSPAGRPGSSPPRPGAIPLLRVVEVSVARPTGAGPRRRVRCPGRAQRGQLDRGGARRHRRGVRGRQARGRRRRRRRPGPGPADAVRRRRPAGRTPRRRSRCAADATGGSA